MADRALEAWISDQLYALVGELLVFAKAGEAERQGERERKEAVLTTMFCFDDFLFLLTSTSLHF